MTVLVIGATGLLGSEVARAASAAGHAVTGTATTATGGLRRLDITDRAAVHMTAAALDPELIVNAASRADSWAVCADGAANVALAARHVGARLVHAVRHGLDPDRIPGRTIAEAGAGPRPANVVLDSTRALSLLTTRLRPATEFLR